MDVMLQYLVGIPSLYLFNLLSGVPLSEQAGLWDHNANEELNFKEVFHVIITTLLNY